MPVNRDDVAVWREGECGVQCSIEEIRSVRGEILTRVVKRHIRTST